ncbi:hypothetical protein TC41_2525 [Alicyclobacillus acidocaldarius subsp. acidocaldarius Tc-4-1]|uniref:Uncharacterized protein n=1 Tax=Alicyclobacillus acidocaldarius (strain Tc-4-1) TaxID=1048834 RepID=F8IHE8_ALIAT|nr:hypothetical protein TC41_2525 [Alicyclobacillus acidocaldarius subsp. acidocaldarius Tc-4-1]
MPETRANMTIFPPRVCRIQATISRCVERRFAIACSRSSTLPR